MLKKEGKVLTFPSRGSRPWLITNLTLGVKATEIVDRITAGEVNDPGSRPIIRTLKKLGLVEMSSMEEVRTAADFHGLDLFPVKIYMKIWTRYRSCIGGVGDELILGTEDLLDKHGIARVLFLRQTIKGCFMRAVGTAGFKFHPGRRFVFTEKI